jgi:hypothetical protein
LWGWVEDILQRVHFSVCQFLKAEENISEASILTHTYRLLNPISEVPSLLGPRWGPRIYISSTFPVLVLLVWGHSLRTSV